MSDQGKLWLKAIVHSVSLCNFYGTVVTPFGGLDTAMSVVSLHRDTHLLVMEESSNSVIVKQCRSGHIW